MGHKGSRGIDLDGTLAEYNGWISATYIGPPVPKMLERVKRWIAKGDEIKIFTARVCALSYGPMHEGYAEARQAELAIQAWCKEHIGAVLPITSVKDFSMFEIWDDRAVQVIPNTGLRADGK